jgi:hypothetical protein
MGIMEMYKRLEQEIGSGFVELDSDDSQKNIDDSAPEQFAHFMAAKRYGNKPRELASWLYNEANDDQREKFIDGIHIAREAAEGWTDAQGEGGGHRWMDKRAGSVAAFDESLDQLEQLIRLKSPVAKPADDMVMADPDAGDVVKPQPFPAVVQLGNKVANYDKYLEMALDDDKPLGQAIERALDVDEREKVVDDIRTKRRKIKDEAGKDSPNQDVLDTTLKELETLQRAWSFAVAHDIAEAVDEGKEEAPEEGPEKEVGKAHQRRVLVFHSPSEAFSKRVLRELDLP